MAAGGPNLLLLLLAIPLLLLAIGSVLLLFALWPRRRGDAPHCRRCGYDLTANESRRCPECGAGLIVPRSIVRGVARRRRAHIAFALVMIGVGLIPLGLLGARWARTFNWYTIAPERWVLSDLTSNQPATQLAAMGELDRRLQAGTLSDRSLLSFARFCLTLQSLRGMRADLRQSAINTLGDLYATQRLAQPEADTFLSQLCQITVATRPQQLRRRGLVYRIELDGRFPVPRAAGAGLIAERILFENTRVTIDGTAIDEPELPEIRQNGSNWTGQVSRSGVAVGRHVLTMETDMSIVRGDDIRPLLTRHQHVELPFEILESEPAGYLVAVDPPNWAGVLRSALRPERLRFLPSRGAGQMPMIEGSFRAIGDLPRSFVYDAILLDPATGREITLLPMRMDPDPARVFTGRGFSAAYEGGPLPQSVTLVLRGSRAGTEATTDLIEYWNGEVRFENVAFDQPDAGAARPGSALTAPLRDPE